MEDEKELKCDTSCCVRNLILLYEGEEFRKYLEHHVANYQLHKRDVSITLQGVDSSSSTPNNDFDHDTISKGGGLLEHINGIANTGSSSLPSWDGVIFPAHMTGALQESNRLWDWNDYLAEQQNSENKKDGVNIEWMDIQPFFRSQAQQQINKKNPARPSSFFQRKSSNDKETDEVTRRILYAPLDGNVISLYYRKDLFAQNQIQVPRTWDDYRDVASFFHGKPWGSNNNTLTGSCVARKSGDNGNNMDAYWALLVLSTMTQTKGTASGFLLDPETVEPILGDAMDETLRIVAQESALSEGNDHEVDYDINSNGLYEGSCAMALSWANQLTTAMNADYEKLNYIGVAPTPGSELVLNRTSGHLETCTPELCPYGTYYDDIGIVNRPSYSAFGGWVGGVSNDSTSSKQHDMADFFSYISNPVESLNDVLPNEQSHVVTPYRYSHTAASNWIDAGFDENTALQYTEAIKEVNSGNTVSEIRIPPGVAIRGIINHEVNNYLLASNENKNASLEDSDSFQDSLRSRITANMDRRIRDAINSVDRETVIKNYQSSLSFPEGHKVVSMNYIDIYYRDTGWGVAALICFSSIAAIFWILWNRKKTAMQAFQPISLVQSAVGFFLMGATLVPIGFDDSLFSKDILNITCMATPWIYVFGYTIFFSSIYSKIQVCTEIYKNPGKYERMVVWPIDSFKLFSKLFLINGIMLGLWTYVDPLKWSRTEKTTYGSPFPNGTVESYGSCKSERFRYPYFGIALFIINLVLSFVAMLQALRCRLLVLEYRQMEWLQLCIVPFFEAWIIGGPVIIILYEQPTAQYVAFIMVIASSSIASASAIFGPKEWYIRKNNILANEREPEIPPIPSQAGVRVLKHPKLESQKHVSNLQNRLVRYTTSNTELAIDLRVLQERFRLLTEKEKLAVVRGMYEKGITKSEIFRMRTSMLDEDEVSKSDTRDSDILSMAFPDIKYNNYQIDTTIGKNSASNGRVSELSIDIDDLKQLRAEAGKLYSQDDDYEPFAGKSRRSIAELIESISGSSFALNSRISEESSENIKPTNSQQQIMSSKVRTNDWNEDVGESTNHTGGSSQLEAHPLSHEPKLKASAPESSSCNSSNEMKYKNDGIEVLNQMIETDDILDLQSEVMMMAEEFKLSISLSEKTSGLQPGISERVGRDIDQMIESDNFRDLQSETMLIAEEFKLNNDLLESVSDLQPGISERVGEDIDQMIESDNIRDLQSETMFMAEEFKLNNDFLESVSDLQPCNSERDGDELKHDGFHTLDVSNATKATSTSTSTIVTENDSKVAAMPPDVQIGPSSKNNRACPELMAISSSGESSGGHMLASKNNYAKKNEGISKHQRAGEPSSDCCLPLKSNEDMVAGMVGDGSNIGTLNPLKTILHERPKTPLTECETISSLRSLVSSAPASAQVSVGLDLQVNASQSNTTSKTNSLSIDGWRPTAAMGGLLTDLSDSTSTSSRAESMTDSIASLEVMSTPRNSEVRMGKDIETLLNYHGFDTIKVAAKKCTDSDTVETNESDSTKLSNVRHRKRELEAKRLSIRRHNQKNPS